MKTFTLLLGRVRSVRPLVRRLSARPDGWRAAASLAVIVGTCRWLGGAGLLLGVTLLHAGEFFLHDGDRVVFLGDSITEQRLYTTYIEAYALSRHPTWKLSFRNAGWGGDTAWLRMRLHADEVLLFAADDARQTDMVRKSVGYGLERDVLPLKPTVVLVNFGMNDHYYQAFRPDILRAYVRAQTEIARVLQAGGARVAFLTPQPIEEKRPDPDQDVRNQALRRFSDALGDVAARTHSLFVDEFDPYLALMKASTAATIGRGDAIHPGPAGHTLMAWAILKGLGATPLVSSATIDGRTGRVESTEACRIDRVTKENGTMAFDRLDDALPMPIDPKAESALSLAPVLMDLNFYDLKIPGLPPGRYTVTIDGRTVSTVNASELAESWRFSRGGGPITEQAQDLLALIFRKNDAYFRRWRNVQLYAAPEWVIAPPELEVKRQAELTRLDREIADLEAAIDIARKPKTHHFLIAPAPAGS
ncbi:MAG TPA: SGNH/GDSL hydrolase family protein [Lacunisphaera sp.]|jgi:hypothetical protein|nr:SGNH/GDSL hydrolase family protein [Lacunisphaera sp.]